MGRQVSAMKEETIKGRVLEMDAFFTLSPLLFKTSETGSKLNINPVQQACKLWRDCSPRERIVAWFPEHLRQCWRAYGIL